MLEFEGVLRNHNGEVLLMFSKYVGTKESNEVEVMGMLVVQIFLGFFKGKLIMESGLANVVMWVLHLGPDLWRSQFYE